MSTIGTKTHEIVSILALHIVEDSFIGGRRVSGEKHRLGASHGQTLSHNVVSSTNCYEREPNTHL
jgi:hypothetical protein